MDESTTGSPVVDTGVDVSTQPSDSITLDEPAANSPDTSTTEVTTEAPTIDDNATWLQSKGIDKSDPLWESKLIKNAREAEAQMSKRSQEAAQLQKALTEPVAQEDQLYEQPDQISQLQAQVETMQLNQSVKDFFAADGDTAAAGERKALEPQMAQIVTENPAIGQMVKGGFMSYDQLFALAKGSSPDYASTLKQDGGREALQSVVDRQQGRATQGIATTGDLSGDTKGDPFLDGFNSY